MTEVIKKTESCGKTEWNRMRVKNILLSDRNTGWICFSAPAFILDAAQNKNIMTKGTEENEL
jgi:hypothetical protein